MVRSYYWCCDVHTCMLFSNRMKRYTVFLEPEKVAQLKRLYEKTGIRPAEAIRRAVDTYLKKKK